jgi:tripartite-type tricarboxylate transporter receptor subunit TctC
MLKSLITPVAALAALLALPAAAGAQAPTDFYKGKTISVYVGASVGGGYDTYARIVARFIGRHIPGNPAVVVENMDGAGGLRLANWLTQVAPKDGTAIGTLQRGIAFVPLLGISGAAFNGPDFAWLGSANNDVSVCVSWKTSPVKLFTDLFTHELAAGALGGGSDDTAQFPRVLNGVLGTKFKLVSGYPGTNDIVLAMERGEVEGLCGWSWSSVVATHSNWIADKSINVLVQTALDKHKDLPDTPLVSDFAKTDTQRAILKLIFARETMGRPFLAPPGTDPGRVAILRKAFTDTMADPDFLAEASKEKLEVNAVPGDKVDALVKEIYQTPPDIAKQAAAMLN